MKARILILLSVAAAIGALFAIPAQASNTMGFSATVSVTNRDDSGANGGNWASDNFNRTLKLYGQGVVANSFCPGITIGACHHIKGTITDKGTYTTVIGNLVPGTGSLNGGQPPQIGAVVTGPMTGTFHYDFYTNVPVSSFSAANGPGTVNGDSPSTGMWPEQFAPTGTQFWDDSGNTNGNEYLGTTGSWSYVEAAGSNTDCPNESSKWVDGSAGNWGSLPADGNILAQSSSSC